MNCILCGANRAGVAAGLHPVVRSVHVADITKPTGLTQPGHPVFDFETVADL
jgi:hypothetical protein